MYCRAGILLQKSPASWQAQPEERGPGVKAQSRFHCQADNTKPKVLESEATTDAPKPSQTGYHDTMMQEFSALDGALLIDKPAGPTSHDVVDAVRRHFGIKKVGHCGTLDPNATGLLIIVLGRGTKLSERLMADDKVYEGAMKFGETTDSYDADGQLINSLPVPPLTVEQLNEAASSFTGDLMQTPPMVSAVKKDGVPLYKLARKGIEVPREPRLVHIYNFRFTSYQEPIGQFRLACTKGTYVRSIAHELGQKLGCGAHLAALRRVASGKFDAAQAIPLEQVMKLTARELEKHVLPFLKLVG
jgi:tRNA pseudouridine55 synthase